MKEFTNSRRAYIEVGTVIHALVDLEIVTNNCYSITNKRQTGNCHSPSDILLVNSFEIVVSDSIAELCNSQKYSR